MFYIFNQATMAEGKVEANKDYYEMTCRPEEDICKWAWQDIDSPDEAWAGKQVYNILRNQRDV